MEAMADQNVLLTRFKNLWLFKIFFPSPNCIIINEVNDWKSTSHVKRCGAFLGKDLSLTFLLYPMGRRRRRRLYFLKFPVGMEFKDTN